MVPRSSRPWHGIYAAIICPMRPDYSIDEQALARHAADVAGVPGIVGLLINGHAGENFVLSREEKRRVVETCVAAVGSRSILVSGVNAECSLDAALHAADAEQAGADAVMVFGPNAWGLGQDDEMAVRHHRHVLDATRLPLMLFQASVGAGRMAYPPTVLRQLLQLPRVVAVKEGSWEVKAYEETRRLAAEVAPQVAIMGSGDEHLFTSYAIGSDGSLVSLAILLPEAIVALDHAVRRGDLTEARRQHAIVQPLAKVVYGMAPGLRATARLKAALHMLGRIPHPTVRPPIGPLDPAEMARLRDALAAAGVLAAERKIA
ncbi:MAG: dihydrodipicolinate synthase family protein [Alphaproteobacteria bacterium]|nr:dihydrodipicolinate synthase family protein [Alphaproteobacteria bacterium]